MRERSKIVNAPISQNKAETNPFGMSHRVRTRLEQMYGTGIVRREQVLLLWRLDSLSLIVDDDIA